MNRATIVFLAVLLMPLGAASSELEQNNKLVWRGFISQTWVRTTDNRIDGPSNKIHGSFDRHEIGFLGSYSVNEYIDFRGMVMYDGSNQDQQIVRHALADFHGGSKNSEANVGIRIGRVKLSMGSMNDTRDNPILRSMDYAPQALYRDQFRTMVNSGDGIQPYTQYLFSDGTMLDLEASFIRPIITESQQDDVVNVLLNVPAKTGRFNVNESAIQSFGAKLTFPHYGAIVRYDRVTMDYMYVGNPTSVYSHFIPSGGMKTTFNYLSLQKYFDHFDITLEGIMAERSGLVWDTVLKDTGYGDPYGMSFLWRYHVNNALSIHTNYNVWYTDSKNRDGTKHASKPGNAPAERYFQRDLNVGFKYVDGSWVFKGSYHRIHGTNTLSIIEGIPMEQMRAPYSMITTSISYAF
jgi:hypothetical protein